MTTTRTRRNRLTTGWAGADTGSWARRRRAPDPRAAGAGAGLDLRVRPEDAAPSRGSHVHAQETRTYYSAAGRTLAVRTATAGTASTQLSFLTADHHGTSSRAIEAVTQAVTKRYSTPFGAPRGDQPTTTWPDDKAFLGKPADITTGLAH
ncbi:hypothetical protein SMICM304S_04740 [Streptomyces microflavus]